MAVILCTSRTIPATGWDDWAAVGTDLALDQNRQIPSLGAALEQAFDSQAPGWLDLAHDLGQTPSAVLAHAPSAATNASDLGLMRAWTQLADDWAARTDRTTLLVCDDPWLYRHLRSRPGIRCHGRPPGLWRQTARLLLRGWLARARFALTAARAARITSPLRPNIPAGGVVLLVYGHPASTTDGMDAYFGSLMREMPTVARVLHGDCPADRAMELGADGRTAALHGWGSAVFALTRLPFARWRPKRDADWLVRRAAQKEGGTAQPAAVAWQIHCQRRFLADIRPVRVAWPWENHCWERDFTRALKQMGVDGVGYQHSVVGHQMLNYSPRSNPDGLDSLPPRIFCSGAATLQQLTDWGIPPERLAVGGTLRFETRSQPIWKPAAPVFMALPFDRAIAAEMVDAAHRAVAESQGRLSFLVKEHPMNPTPLREGPGVTRTRAVMESHPALNGVVWAATTVGLQAVLMGLPSIRFRPTGGRLAIDILPQGIAIPVAEAATLAATLATARPHPPLDADWVFAPVAWPLWRAMVKGTPLPTIPRDGAPSGAFRPFPDPSRTSRS